MARFGAAGLVTRKAWYYGGICGWKEMSTLSDSRMDVRVGCGVVDCEEVGKYTFVVGCGRSRRHWR